MRRIVPLALCLACHDVHAQPSMERWFTPTLTPPVYPYARSSDFPDRLVLGPFLPNHEHDPRLIAPPSFPFTLAAGTDVQPSWPLTRAPSLEPHFAITKTFEHAASDSWRELCRARNPARGWNSKTAEILDYLMAWCESNAVAERLLPLVTARAPGLAAAVRSDVVDLVAFKLPAREAMQWLAAHHLPIPESYDALAATYDATDRDADALAVLDTLRGFTARPSIQCRRMQRELALRPNDEVARRLEDLAATSHDPICGEIVTSRTCRRLRISPRYLQPICGAAALERTIAGEAKLCARYVLADPRVLKLGSLFDRWPTQNSSACVWQTLAQTAQPLFDLDGAEALAVTALENSALDSTCDARTIDSVVRLANAAKRSHDHRAAFDARVDALRAMTEPTCLANRAAATRRI